MPVVGFTDPVSRDDITAPSRYVFLSTLAANVMRGLKKSRRCPSVMVGV